VPWQETIIMKQTKIPNNIPILFKLYEMDSDSACVYVVKENTLVGEDINEMDSDSACDCND
jgi:hypothetical protein